MTAVCCPPAPIPTHSPWWRVAVAEIARRLDAAPTALRRFAGGDGRAGTDTLHEGCASLAAALGDTLSRDVGLPAAARERAQRQADRALHPMGW